MFNRPVIARGELEYLGPGQLGKRIDSPYQELTTIADGQVTVQRGTRKPRQISLERIPELEGFLRGFSALLGGDTLALERDFDLASSGDSVRWQLQLTPKDARLRKRIKALEVDGENQTARCFSIIDADNDASILMVESLAAIALPKPLTRSAVESACRGGKVAQ